MRYSSKLMALLVSLVGLLTVSCAAPPPVVNEGPVWRDDDNKPISEPDYEEESLIWLTFARTGPEQIIELLDLDRNVRKLTGNPTQAKNTNRFDEVPNSSWFTNRHGYPATRLSSGEIQVGKRLTPGPDTSGYWKVFRPKLGGATPGFWIEDSRGDQYLIKFDPTGNPEMATAAGAMGARFFHACGYNVPQETIVYWKPENLQIREGAKLKLFDGTRRALTMEDIDSLLTLVHHQPNGTIRSLASLNLGKVKGPFMYEGVRKSDPNDWCPHQHRRELRALRVIGSLVNHYDLKDHNSMDVYFSESGQGYLQHYLMDFGSTFGSDGRSPKIPRKGYANTFDLRDVLVVAFTAGLKTWAWEDGKDYEYPSIGYFESEMFEPQKFDPIIPNPAFEQLTIQDAYWGAKTVMAFDSSDLNALVDAGELSNPEARAYLLKTLKERQVKIGKHWFSKVNPIDYPRISSSDTNITIRFADLWISSGLGFESSHEFELRLKGDEIIGRRTTVGEVISLNENDLRLMRQRAAECGSKDGCLLFELSVYSTRDGRRWKMPTVFELFLGELFLGDSGSASRIVGIKHPS